MAIEANYSEVFRKKLCQAALVVACLWIYGWFVLIYFSSSSPSVTHDVAPDVCTPIEIVLGLTEDSTSMRVTWRTQGSNCGASVRYGLAHEINFLRKARIAYGISYNADSSMFCEHEASTYTFTLYLHSVVMTGLIPSRKYVYIFLKDDRRFEFTASKRAGDSSSYVFYAFGDMGVKQEKTDKYDGAQIVQRNMEHEMAKDDPLVILEIGDISYANGDAFVWDAFMSSIEPFSTRSPWISGVGNHEYDLKTEQIDPWGIMPYQPEWGNLHTGDARGECGLPIYWRFPFGRFFSPVETIRNISFIPTPPFGEAFPPFYYSFDQGMVHFVVISTEHDVETGSPQLAWLENDLASVDHCKTPFTISGGHRPFYAPKSDAKNYRTGEGLAAELEEVLIRYKVDTYIAGHIHAYYRTCEARNGRCVDPGHGLVSLVIGTAGHRLESRIDFGDFSFEEMTLIVTYGFGRFRVSGNEYLDFEFVESETGEVVDTHRFISKSNCSRPITI